MVALEGDLRARFPMAELLEDPALAETVARACAQNPLAPAVPCHRVVGKGGDLTGYRWGVPNKRRLLEAEGALGAASPR
jgi:AraC family transcriptional regulator of adaptative response/methylated-DNA-[protein]-cysteine methyltransferase